MYSTLRPASSLFLFPSFKKQSDAETVLILTKSPLTQLLHIHTYTYILPSLYHEVCTGLCVFL